MCKTRTVASKNTFFIKSSIFVLVLQESPEGSLEVPDIKSFTGLSKDVAGTTRAGCKNTRALIKFPWRMTETFLNCYKS